MAAYDAIIIGTGQAGPALARRLAGAGWTIAVIERKLFGGTCVNNGCTPTKTLIASAYAAYLARRAADEGLVVGIAADDAVHHDGVRRADVLFRDEVSDPPLHAVAELVLRHQLRRRIVVAV